MDHLINLLVDDVQPSALMCMTLRTLSDQSVFSEVQAPPENGLVKVNLAKVRAILKRFHWILIFIHPQ